VELIGYTSPYIPVEILSLTGLKPYRLLHGDIELSQSGEEYVRIDACPLVKSNIAFVIQNQKRFGAVVGATECDMLRRMFEILEDKTSIPIYVINNPRTRQPGIFYDEIDWLTNELKYLSGRRWDETVIHEEIEKWETLRRNFRMLDKKRKATPSLLSTTSFHNAAEGYYKGGIEEKPTVPEDHSNKPRVFLLGSEITYESNWLLELIEKEVRIIGDFVCGISRFLNITVENKNLEGLKTAYYHQTPGLFKRPNAEFYDYINTQLKERACNGVIVWTLDYCDTYEFEIKRMREIFKLPLLHIKSDLSHQNISQLKIRLAAFREIL